ncbi:hypothetical protein FJ651_11165 [Paucihalobacter ruber]|uniref:Uncharacterized protein n=1 Tax=Paucihalobacter ruber TaxID=2567861 RepID=A0A506PGW2_9FLAO|nr:hypothetical protein [Paucihalobacter ruber]TPV32859.1 hypothetical protein FJ651_11165 [Paucihalobacter ruber]
MVFFDESTKPKYRNTITNLQSQFSGFSPIFVDGMDAFFPTIKEIWVITNYKIILDLTMNFELAL